MLGGTLSKSVEAVLYPSPVLLVPCHGSGSHRVCLSHTRQCFASLTMVLPTVGTEFKAFLFPLSTTYLIGNLGSQASLHVSLFSSSFKVGISSSFHGNKLCRYQRGDACSPVLLWVCLCVQEGKGNEGHTTSFAEVLHPLGYAGPDTGTDTRSSHHVLASRRPVQGLSCKWQAKHNSPLTNRARQDTAIYHWLIFYYHFYRIRGPYPLTSPRCTKGCQMVN